MAAIDKAHVIVEVAEEERGRRSTATGRSYSDSDTDRSEEEEEEEEEERCSSESGSEIVERESSVSESSVDLECEVADEVKMHVAKVERDCRICHLSLDASNHESGIPIELGCSCKADLAAAHKQCAEAWFKIKGNK